MNLSSFWMKLYIIWALIVDKIENDTYVSLSSATEPHIEQLGLIQFLINCLEWKLYDQNKKGQSKTIFA